MPEGPEIRREADLIARVLEGQRLRQVEFHVPRLGRFERRLAGRHVKCVEARGKALLTRFDGGLTLYSHNQLYGRWYVVPRGQTPATGRALRVALRTCAHSALLYSASDIQVLTDGQLERQPYLARLGPDILDETLQRKNVVDRLTAPQFSGRGLAALYLDQGFLAGVGNYLRSEILWYAGLHFRQKPRDLGAAALRRLAGYSLSIPRRSYRTGGVTNSPSQVQRLRRDGLAREEYRFAVFGRAGLPCYRCDTAIRRESAGSRRVYFCPACQAG